MDRDTELRDLSSVEWRHRFALEEKLVKLYEVEEIYWQKRGGEKWILQGDSNSSFFHKCANGRKRKKAIFSLEDRDKVLTEKEELKKHITDYYKNLFGREEEINMHLDENFWEQSQRMSEEGNTDLTKPFTLEELDAAVKDMKNSTAPGPDGFSIEFFKEFWPKVREDINEMLDDLHAGVLDLWRLNYEIIILLPKLREANNIKQYRHICLLNVIYKIITKVLTLRLTRWAGKVISKKQTAFLPGRSILDGVVILQEVLHELRVKKEEGIILKLNFEKAYDKVSWSFLEEVMIRKGFDSKWIGWTMQAVRGGRVAVDINGERGDFFRSFKGLRQGDPLSPLLFNLVADALSSMLSAAASAGDIEGLVPHLVEGGLTHLQYADDMIIFLKNSDQNIANLKIILLCYEMMSGLKINYNKSEVFVMGVEEEEKERIATCFLCKVGQLPITYLGMPVSDCKLSKAQLSYLSDKVGQRLRT